MIEKIIRFSSDRKSYVFEFWVQDQPTGKWLQTPVVSSTRGERKVYSWWHFFTRVTGSPLIRFISSVLLLVPRNLFLMDSTTGFCVAGDPLEQCPTVATTHRIHSRVPWGYWEEEKDNLVGDQGRICKPLTGMESSMKSMPLERFKREAPWKGPLNPSW